MAAVAWSFLANRDWNVERNNQEGGVQICCAKKALRGCGS
ncbi:hypothetical protein AcetOrient_orf01226 [Acetobacter orientalis]|uniref:Uncharacterized protein n=1 Tax=Acetobacter orientalis TaxID=146474 RepID=A0A2Z5ZFP8_9PROT|nr:hypothetical protein AcetOrient_orf01226 [Acetobacter orientalis]